MSLRLIDLYKLGDLNLNNDEAVESAVDNLISENHKLLHKKHLSWEKECQNNII